MDILWLQIVRLVPMFVLLGYAAWMDHRQGWVSNKVWLYTPIGFALLLVELWFTPYVAVYALAVAGACVAIGFVLFYFGMGGADCKALMMLGLCYPLAPSMLVYPMFVLSAAAFLVAARYILHKGKGGLKGKVRFLPYVFVGMLIALL